MVVHGQVPEALRHYDLVAPELLWTESVSALREAAWRGVINEDLAVAAVGRTTEMGVAVVNHERLRSTAYGIAQQLGWAKTYDAEYVALAQLLDCSLFTLDGRLARGASRLATILGPADL